MYKLCIFFVIAIFLINSNCSASAEYLYYENINDINQTREILKDKYSKKVFDSYCNFYFSELKDKTPFCIAKFGENNHPKVRVRKGDTVIDVGISGSTYRTEDFFKLTGKKGLVIGIEANPKLIDKINNNLKKYNNFKLYNYALYNYTGKGIFDLGENPDDPDNIAGHIPYLDYNSNNDIYIDYITLDDFIKKYNIEKLDYIKIDIEGAELDAIKASEKTLKKFKPNLSISCHRPGYVIDIIKYIDSLNLNYEFYLAQFDASGYENIYWRDYIIYATVRK